MTSVVLRLPMPPSVNALWRSGRGRVYASPKYKAWKEEAGWELMRQRPGKVIGTYNLKVTLERPRSNADLDNFGTKAISDLLQEHQVIENDKLAEEITIQWGYGGSGCYVEVEAN